MLLLSSDQNKACFASDGSDLRPAVETILKGDDATKVKEVYDMYGGSMNEWCVDRVKDFSRVFANQPDFNEDISGWNTSSATTLAYMFQNARSFNGNLSPWNVGSVVDFSHMFDGASSMGNDLCAWGPQIISQHLASNNVLMEDMFVGTMCMDTASPMILVEKQVMGPFCSACGLAEGVIASMPEISRPSSFGPANTGEIHGDASLNNKNAQELFLSVHSHEPAARGAQIVLVMLLFSSLNILLIASWAKRRRERQRRNSTTNSSRRNRGRSSSYSQLNLNEDSTSEDEEMELAQVVGTALSLIGTEDEDESFEDAEQP